MLTKNIHKSTYISFQPPRQRGIILLQKKKYVLGPILYLHNNPIRLFFLDEYIIGAMERSYWFTWLMSEELKLGDVACVQMGLVDFGSNRIGSRKRLLQLTPGISMREILVL